MVAGNGLVHIAQLIQTLCSNPNMFKRLLNGPNELRNTPLHWAVLNNQAAFVLFLLENQVDTSVKNSDAQTALDLAITIQNSEIIVC